MTEDQKEELRLKMLEYIEQLKVEIARHKEASKPVEPDVAIGRLTRMDAIGAKNISEAAMRASQSRLIRLENSLRRIDSDEFGLCIDCDEPIPIKRMMLLPESVRCVRCAEER